MILHDDIFGVKKKSNSPSKGKFYFNLKLTSSM